MNYQDANCFCGHAHDEHEQDGPSVCTVEGCDCEMFDLDFDPDEEALD